MMTKRFRVRTNRTCRVQSFEPPGSGNSRPRPVLLAHWMKREARRYITKMNPARTEFTRITAREPIPLAHGALLIAKEEYPALDVDHYLDRLAALGREASAMREANNTVEQVQTLSDSCSSTRALRATATTTATRAIRFSMKSSIAGSEFRSRFRCLSRGRTACRTESLRVSPFPTTSWSRRSTSAAS